MTSTPFAKANNNKTTRLIQRFIDAEKEEERTVRYFGILILRIRSPLPTTAPIPVTVVSVKKFHIIIPINKYTG